AFKLLHPVEERYAWFLPTHANAVTAMTRHATVAVAKKQDQPREWIECTQGYPSTQMATNSPSSAVLPAIDHRDELLNTALETRRLTRGHSQADDYIAGFQDALGGKSDNPWQAGR